MSGRTDALEGDLDGDRSLDPRPLVVLVAAPLLGLGQAVSYYGSRAAFVPYWTAHGLSPDQVYEALAVSASAPVAGSALGLALVLLGGGWSAAIAGGLMLSLGLLGLGGLAGEDLLVVWMALAAAGRAAAGLGILVVLADAFRGGRIWLGVTAMAALLIAVNLGASGVSFGVGQLGTVLEGGLWFPAMAMLAGTTTLLAMGAAVAWGVLGLSWPEPDTRRRRVLAGPVLLAALLAILGGLGVAMLYGGMNVAFDIVYRGGGQSLASAQQWAQPIVAVGVGTLVAGGGVAAHVLGAPRRPLVLVVAGALLATLAVGLSWAGPFGAAAAILLLVVAELLILPAWVPALARAVHWRLLALTVGLGRLVMDTVGWGLSALYLADLVTPEFLLGLQVVGLLPLALVAVLYVLLVVPGVDGEGSGEGGQDGRH